MPMTRTPRQALWLGAANGILGLVEVVGVLTLALRPLFLVLGGWFLLSSALYLTSFMLQRRGGAGPAPGG